jgi:hypothetical protein
VHAEHVGPQLFVAERVEAENSLSLSTRLLGILVVSPVAIAVCPIHKLLRGRRLTESGDDVREYKSEYR